MANAEVTALKERLLHTYRSIKYYPRIPEQKDSFLTTVLLRTCYSTAKPSVLKTITVWPPSRINIEEITLFYVNEYLRQLLKIARPREGTNPPEHIIAVRHYAPRLRRSLTVDSGASIPLIYPPLENAASSMKEQESHTCDGIIVDGPIPPSSPGPDWKWLALTRESLREAGRLLAYISVKETPIFSLSEQEIYQLRMHFTPPTKDTPSIQTTLADIPVILKADSPNSSQRSHLVNIIECAAVTSASQNATLSRVARASGTNTRPSQRLTPEILPEPPKKALGLSAGYEFEGAVALFDTGSSVSLM